MIYDTAVPTPVGEINIGPFDMEIWLPLAFLVVGSQNLP